MKKIAILTSGGDAPGMNGCLADLVKLCVKQNIIPIGVMRGYQGLLDEDFIDLTVDFVEDIDYRGGSVLKTARCKEMYESSGIKRAQAIIKKHKIDCLVVLGGNGSFKGLQLISENGINVIGIPATIDNDLLYTDKSLGFDTAVQNAVNAINNIKDTMLSNNRGMVIEVMGRESGNIALNTAMATCADSLIVKEIDYDLDEITNKMIKLSKNNLKASPLVIVAEHIIDIVELSDKFQKITDKQFKAIKLGYIQRGGTPSMFDRVFASQMAVKALELYNNRDFGKVIGLKATKIITQDIKKIGISKSNFDYDLYDMFQFLNK